MSGGGVSQQEPSHPPETRLHASCVAFARRGVADRDGAGVCGAEPWAGVLIRAPSGGGKSAFALRLIALGARLVADDQTVLRRCDAGQLHASAPKTLFGLLEARGLGLLRLPALRSAPVHWIVDLKIGGAEARLPSLRTTRILDVDVPSTTLPEDERAASALCCLVRDGALLDPEADLAEFKGEAKRSTAD